jgi:hypothetical protein
MRRHRFWACFVKHCTTHLHQESAVQPRQTAYYTTSLRWRGLQPASAVGRGSDTSGISELSREHDAGCSCHSHTHERQLPSQTSTNSIGPEQPPIPSVTA